MLRRPRQRDASSPSHLPPVAGGRELLVVTPPARLRHRHRKGRRGCQLWQLAALQRSPGAGSQAVTVHCSMGGEGLLEHTLALHKFVDTGRESYRFGLGRVTELVARLGVVQGGAVALSVLPDGRLVAEAAGPVAPPDPSLVPLTDSALRYGKVTVRQGLVERLLGAERVRSTREGGEVVSVRLLGGEGQAEGGAACSHAALLKWCGRSGGHGRWNLTGLTRWLRGLGAASGDHLRLEAVVEAGPSSGAAAAATAIATAITASLQLSAAGGKGCGTPSCAAGATGAAAVLRAPLFLPQLQLSPPVPCRAERPAAVMRAAARRGSGRALRMLLPLLLLAQMRAPLPGELRLCGLTFAASVAPAVRRDMRKWKQPGARAMGELQAVLAQMRIPGFDGSATVGAGGGAAPAAPAGAAPWLDSAVLCWSLGQLLRAASGPGPKDQLPSGPVITRAVQPGVDLARGGAGLFAGARIPRSAAVGVLGGYVQPAGAAQGFRARGVEALSYASRAELRRRADAAGEGSEGLVWSFLAGSFSLPYGAPEEALLAGEDGPLPPLELHMLGYGNLTALVNDPRSDPWGERLRVDRPGDASVAEAAAANCMVVPVCVRGLLLPVLVALHDIAPGEQILRDYGAGWWAGLAGEWRVLHGLYGASAAGLLHGAEGLAAYPPAPPPAAAASAPGLAAGAAEGPLQAAGGSTPANCQAGGSATREAAQQQQQQQPRAHAPQAAAPRPQSEQQQWWRQ
ncbi:hypothetical protein TSOC_005756 [Tetrabaena socialis]|uniref:SET domain-containing protein n=1 Tax=Tetrabaena socialis TaxID=47790 RepID=A0A2J8A5C7_9CHLO|nr:hypothetical protein TSOC_005756 [Tetrabaena socialis]|eukprot:PNH07729.1 hypothetical protein TSOC_005756 [Tetrabaena socialis]